MSTPQRPTERQLWMLCMQDKAERFGGEIPRIGNDAEICARQGWLAPFGFGEYIITEEGRRQLGRRFGASVRPPATAALDAR